jgi:addiction module RelE/StbE family toxin
LAHKNLSHEFRMTLHEKRPTQKQKRQRLAPLWKVELVTEPRPAKAKALKGYSDLLRIRVGSYRIVYRVEQEVLTILVIAVGHRKDVYRRL